MAVKRILDRKGLKAKGIYGSNPHLLRQEAEGKFPKRIKVSENRVGWLEEEVDAWIDARAAERGSVTVPMPAPVLLRRQRAAADATPAPEPPSAEQPRRRGPRRKIPIASTDPSPTSVPVACARRE
jgi:prophage regulatory protein